MKEISLSLIIQ